MSDPGIHDGRAVAFGLFNPDLGTEDIVVVAEIEAELLPAEIQDLSRRLRGRGGAGCHRSQCLPCATTMDREEHCRQAGPFGDSGQASAGTSRIVRRDRGQPVSYKAEDAAGLIVDYIRREVLMDETVEIGFERRSYPPD